MSNREVTVKGTPAQMAYCNLLLQQKINNGDPNAPGYTQAYAEYVRVYQASQGGGQQQGGYGGQQQGGYGGQQQGGFGGQQQAYGQQQQAYGGYGGQQQAYGQQQQYGQQAAAAPAAADPYAAYYAQQQQAQPGAAAQQYAAYGQQPGAQ